MPKKESESEQIKTILRELDKSKFAKFAAERLNEQASLQKYATLAVVLAILGTVLILNLWSKLTPESNGWIIAALIGYLFGRAQK